MRGFLVSAGFLGALPTASLRHGGVVATGGLGLKVPTFGGSGAHVTGGFYVATSSFVDCLTYTDARVKPQLAHSLRY